MRKILTILFLFLFTLAGATTYYVKTGGNDASAGTSDATAWAHHPWMSTWTAAAKVLSPGDIVRFKRGDTWSRTGSSTPYITIAQNGSAGNHIKMAAYGAGSTRPILYVTSASGENIGVIHAIAKSYITIDSLDIKNWKFTYGSEMGVSFIETGSTACHDITITHCLIHEVPHTAIYTWSDCYNMIVGDTTVLATATTSLYSNNVYNFGFAGILLMGANAADGVSNNYAYYNYVHDCTTMSSSVVVNTYSIHFEAASTSNSWPSYCYCRYNYSVGTPTWENLDIHGGSYIYFQDNYVTGFGSTGILIASYSMANLTPTLHHVYCDRNIIEQPASGWVTGRENGFIVVWNSVAPATQSYEIYIRDNIMRYTSRPTSGVFAAITVNYTKGLTISGNQIYNGSTSAASKGCLYFLGSINENVIIENNFIKQWGPSIYVYSGGQITGSFIVRENIITQPPASAAIRTYNAIGAAAQIYLYNNVFLNYDYTYVVYMPNGITSGGTLTAKNNISEDYLQGLYITGT